MLARVFRNVPRGGVHAAVVCPLIEDVYLKLRYFVGNGILRYHGSAEIADQLIYAVTDLRVCVVRAGREYNDRHIRRICLAQHTLPLVTDTVHMSLLLCKSRLACRLYLGERYPVIVAQQHRVQLFRQLAAVQSNIVADNSHILGKVHIRADNLGVICNDRTVVVVVAFALVDVIGHAGIENRLYSVVDKLTDMTVYELCGVAYGIGRDRRLTVQVCIASRRCGADDLKAECGKEGVPERVQLVHVQSHRNAYPSAFA